MTVGGQLQQAVSIDQHAAIDSLPIDGELTVMVTPFHQKRRQKRVKRAMKRHMKRWQLTPANDCDNFIDVEGSTTSFFA